MSRGSPYSEVPLSSLGHQMSLVGDVAGVGVSVQ